MVCTTMGFFALRNNERSDEFIKSFATSTVFGVEADGSFKQSDTIQQAALTTRVLKQFATVVAKEWIHLPASTIPEIEKHRANGCVDWHVHISPRPRRRKKK